MSADHKRPLYAFVLVAALSVIVVGHGLRSDALVDILRAAPLHHRIVATGPAPGQLPDNDQQEREESAKPSNAPSVPQTSSVLVEPVRPASKPGARPEKKSDSRTKQKPGEKKSTDGTRTSPPRNDPHSRHRVRPDTDRRTDKHPRSERSPRHSTPHQRDHAPRSERRAPRSTPPQSRRDERGPSHGHGPRDHRGKSSGADPRERSRNTPGRHSERRPNHGHKGHSPKNHSSKSHSHKGHGHKTRGHHGKGPQGHGHGAPRGRR